MWKKWSEHKPEVHTFAGTIDGARSHLISDTIVAVGHFTEGHVESIRVCRAINRVTGEETLLKVNNWNNGKTYLTETKFTVTHWAFLPE